MVERGLEPAKFVHVPNGVPVARAFTADDGELPVRVEELVAQERSRGRLLIGFAGGFKLSTPLEMMLDQARLLSAGGASFFIAGDGPGAGAMRERVAHSGLDNFHMLGQLPKLAVQKFLSRMDALAVSFTRSPLWSFGISPNKLFDYMLAGKPILQASDAGNDIVTEAKCGFTVEPENPTAFAEAVSRLRALSAEERRQLGDNGRRFVVENHDYGVLARRFLEAVRGRPFNELPTVTQLDLTPANVWGPDEPRTATEQRTGLNPFGGTCRAAQHFWNSAGWVSDPNQPEKRGTSCSTR
jgi:glycosyltransferase involved in cell wall biosynthesis